MTGRVVSKRESSTKLTFYDLVQNGESIQVVASRGRYNGTREQFESENRQVYRGDIACELLPMTTIKKKKNTVN
jgi:lysyl-tRNA synthetase class 2